MYWLLSIPSLICAFIREYIGEAFCQLHMPLHMQLRIGEIDKLRCYYIIIFLVQSETGHTVDMFFVL